MSLKQGLFLNSSVVITDAAIVFFGYLPAGPFRGEGGKGGKPRSVGGALRSLGVRQPAGAP